MTIESSIVAALTSLVAGRVYPDVGPFGVARPYITYQQAGGASVNFMDTATLPSQSNGRFQINVWSDTRLASAALIKQVEQAMRSTLKATVIGQPASLHEPDTNLYGSRQDFSIWQ
jgi:hypothetical protein